ncbi:MAG: UvrD-helicase domain-containing protein [Sulfuricellaceae bacterium]|nr:UvrD-helicase domain-containing protein [Sulfuricellaceae bacterium]
MTIPFLSGLNPEQREAVTLPRQSALILAGAGSGKTRVLTMRIAYLIQTGQASPHGILAVTFTNKAAKEMLVRLSALLPINTRGMWVGTFHGLCNRMLRAHHRDAGLPALFQILDNQDQLAAVKRVLKSLNIDDEKYPPRQVQQFINRNKEQGLRAEKVEAYDPHTQRLVECFAAYDVQCGREGVVDFAELLLRSYELLCAHPELRKHYQQRFQYLLVDEFQDTNRLQYQWLKLLAGESSAIFAVGDDDQSIYAFRGAHTGNMAELERDFSVEKVIKLERNYRSHGNILNAANALISYNQQRKGKNLWTDDSAGEPIRVFAAPTDHAEAEFIVEEATALAREGTGLSGMAVLYRSNAQSRVLEHALFRAGLPYRVYGGLRFFERQEIKHALAYLRLLANPDDDGSLLRIINFPARGIGARTLEQLQDLAASQGLSLWRAARLGALGGKAGSGIKAFVQLIETLGDGSRDLALPEIVEQVLEHSGLLAHYRQDKQEEDRLENLNELVNAAAVYAEEYDGGADAELAASLAETSGWGGPVLAAFLTHASLEAGEHQADGSQEALQLMTVHAAKGLEFHAVFISGLEEGLFPHENSMMEADGLEEERRLMYVAITRARRRLYLSYAQSRMLHGQMRYGVASRFLRELPENLLKQVGGWDDYAAALPPQIAPTRGQAPGHTTRGQAFRVQPSSHASDHPFSIGQNVLHAKFGNGVIVNCEGHGSDARVQVNFRDAGIKWLALEYAKLLPA